MNHFHLRESIKFTLLFFLGAQLDYEVKAMEIGVGVHVGQGRVSAADVVEGINKLGVVGVRDEVYWDHVERLRGELSLNKHALEVKRLMEDRTIGKASVLVLGYGNPLYDEGGRPLSTTALAGFERYSRYVARQFEGHVGHLEIWNEWNLPVGRNLKQPGKPADYINLARAAISGIQNAGFSGKILIGGVGGDWPDWEFSRAIFRSGLLHKTDGYSVHLYNFAKSSDPSEMIARLRRLQEVIFEETMLVDFPIYITEVGWPTNKSKFGVDSKEQIGKIARFLFLASAFDWIKSVYVYELFDRNSGAPSSIEDNFGILNESGGAKAASCGLSAAVTLLKSYRYRTSGALRDGDWIRLSGKANDVVVKFRKKLVSEDRGASSDDGGWTSACAVTNGVNYSVKGSIGIADSDAFSVKFVARDAVFPK